MGTNLSQVFISNGDILNNDTSFNSSSLFSAPNSKVGFWADGKYPEFVETSNPANGIDAPLFNTQVDVSAVADAGAAGDIVTIANPLWRYNTLQVVQGTSGNPIATPLLDTRNIRSVSVTSYDATEGHKVTLTPDSTFAPATIGDVSVRFVIRTQPTDIMSYHDANATNYTILSGTDPLPLGVFNTTNHKVITIDIAEEDYTNRETFCDALDTAVSNHGLLSKMVVVTQVSTTGIYFQSKHVGLIFDVAVSDESGDSMLVSNTAANKIVPTIAGQVLGVGNPWQVLGEEIRCRSRYGNFNRMYLPQNMPTYTAATGNYHKIVMEYEHNWPTSTGIAPAGALNQVVVYVEDTTTTNLAAALPANSISATAGTTVKYLF